MVDVAVSQMKLQILEDLRLKEPELDRDCEVEFLLQPVVAVVHMEVLGLVAVHLVVVDNLDIPGKHHWWEDQNF